MFNIKAHKIDHKALENQLNQLICIYRNESEYVQIIRISHTKFAFLERTVFPNQCVQFSALADELLEIWEVSVASSVHADTIPCYQLVVATGIDVNKNFTAPVEANRDCQSLLALTA